MTGMSAYQDIIHLSRYARWNDTQGRREFLPETVDRYIGHFRQYLHQNHKMDPDDEAFETARQGIIDFDSLPSMRCLMSAGKALQLEPMCGFNCTYRAVDGIVAFSEIMYCLMCTCGVGFSVERQFTDQLPIIARRMREINHTIWVADSRLGWCKAFANLLLHLYDGEIPGWDTSTVRKKGARLKTMGGTASGPEPLIELFKFTIDTFKNAVGRRLSSLECHDIVCKIGDIVVVGGVRRAALISLSNPSDNRLRTAKAGDWRRTNPWRELSNNSAAYTERPTVENFMSEWLALYQSKSGERGFFSRVAATEKCRSIGRKVVWDGDEDDPIDFGTNPCGEILLRSGQTCNLTEPVARATDTFEDLVRKVTLGAMLGTWQSTLTKFGFVGKQWQANCEEERLLGVSLTGIMDCPLLNGTLPHTEQVFAELRRVALSTNAKWADRLGIPRSAAVTCVKPSGTVSQLVNAASGIHPRFAKMFVRRVTFDNHDPVLKVLQTQGFVCEPHWSKPNYMTMVLFPMRAPEGAICEGDRTHIETLEHWKMVRDHWTDHNPSITVQLDEKDWPSAGSWVWDNFSSIGGLTFLPRDGGVYTQMPFTKVSEGELVDLEGRTPTEVDWSMIKQFEKTDSTETAGELACVGGACEIK